MLFVGVAGGEKERIHVMGSTGKELAEKAVEARVRRASLARSTRRTLPHNTSSEMCGGRNLSRSRRISKQFDEAARLEYQPAALCRAGCAFGRRRDAGHL